jgi:predicted phosphodiesterase
VKEKVVIPVVLTNMWQNVEQNLMSKIDIKAYDGKKLKFGFISDTHLCSKHQQRQLLHAAYKIFDRENVEFVCHTGDFTEGNGSHYAGQIQELFLYTFDDQVRYVVMEYPKLKLDRRTYFITGDHDLDWFKAGGKDIGEAIASKRPDLIYCGQSGAYLTINENKRKFIYLHHPRGGGAYAKSYKAQKWIEAVAPENKPQIYLTGHFHSIHGFMSTRNVHWVAAGCLQSQTQFLTASGSEVINSFAVITLRLDKEGSIRRFIPEFYTSYVPMINDYPHFQFQREEMSNQTELKL